jgi:3'-phosphoadenosine 5'-phosphosulfate sulfotransferase (PAPS reductase)/FAD synthetase
MPAERDGLGRVVCRFSCGVPSLVAAKLAIAEYGADRVEVVRSDTRSEHPDNERFLRDAEEWLGKKAVVLASDEYRDIWHVYRKERFIRSHKGVKCRGELKLAPFYRYYQPTDLLVFGYTADSRDAARAVRLQATSPEMMTFPLIKRGLVRADCMAIVRRAGIEIPMMYRLGFNNNNCLGCPNGGMGYWNLIRIHFPDRFEEMCLIQDELGPGSWFLERRGERISLRMLEPGDGDHRTEPEIDCSIMCGAAEAEIAA